MDGFSFFSELSRATIKAATAPIAVAMYLSLKYAGTSIAPISSSTISVAEINETISCMIETMRFMIIWY
ncbi:hypothetical protein FACS1894181_05420 [Bacteroidia bacterium]|nr:hypothetical protein FACS1894181_05420 [Bacteroidia bacterium]